jgi:hypothetical protein
MWFFLSFVLLKSDSSGHLEAVRALVGPDMQGDILAKQACVFSVSSPSKFIHLVLIVHRVLQGFQLLGLFVFFCFEEKEKAMRRKLLSLILRLGQKEVSRLAVFVFRGKMRIES